MRTKLLILFFFFAANAIKAQIGVQGHYHNFNSVDEQSATYNSFSAGLDYWFRAKRVRLEFRPFLGFESLNSRMTDRSFQGLSFEFQTLFYPMDWFNDCQCPTFGKSNDFVKKGFFFTVAPYIGMPIGGPAEWESATELVWGLKAGAGIDIGLSDYITVSPFARLIYLHDQFTRPVGVDRSGTAAFQVGLILGFRWDKENF